MQIAPSLLSANFGCLAEEIRTVEVGGARILHLDVMDGHFVPNITFGPPLVRSIRQATDLFLDTHLMISHPLGFLEPFVRSGADLLTLHAEALGCEDGGGPSEAGIGRFNEAAASLRAMGCGIGLSFRPATHPNGWLQRVGEQLDLVLMMTVEPGFGGQAFMGAMLPRIQVASQLAKERGWGYQVEVDGGVSVETARACFNAGARILVAGSAVFDCEDRIAALGNLRKAACGRACVTNGGLGA
ncbi:MAG: ribulose-phosphate 3-epimerase [Candidatus Eisenbacteria sp.]|nr:ribulose-phosphate 3-epimerase [Candidatus Eisenbacteria bacterium]